MLLVLLNAQKERVSMDKIKICRYCHARDITPVELTTRHGSRTEISFLCPRCGETLGTKWSKKKKGGEQNA